MSNNLVVATRQMIRAFLQTEGPVCHQHPQYAGRNFEHVEIEGFTINLRGSSTIHHRGGLRAQTWEQVAKSYAPPDVISGTIKINEWCGGIPWIMQGHRCKFNVYEVAGKCTDLSDLYNSFDGGYVLIYSYLEPLTVDLGGRTAFDSDDPIEVSLEVEARSVYPVGPISFYEDVNDGLITTQVKDSTYSRVEDCGNCGPRQGCQDRVYSIQANPIRVVYSLENAHNDTRINNDVLYGASQAPATDEPVAVVTIGNYLVVVSENLAASGQGAGGNGGYHYTELDNNGNPGPVGWSQITAGFDASPNDAWVSDSSRIFIAADGGYIFAVDDLYSGGRNVFPGAGGLPNFNRVRGCGARFMVAVGDTGVLYYTTDGGDTWDASPTPTPSATGLPVGINAPTGVAAGANITALATIDRYTWWIGDDLGNLYCTNDGGNTWSPPVAFQGYGAGTNPMVGGVITDIDFATPETGWFAISNGITSVLWATITGGDRWTPSQPRVWNSIDLPNIINIAVPRCDNDDFTRANYLLLSGDGQWITGRPQIA